MSGPFKSSRDVIIRTEFWAAAVRLYESVLGWRAKSHLPAADCAVVVDEPSVPICYVRDPQGPVFNIVQAPQ
jgi:hypothetical protein